MKLERREWRLREKLGWNDGRLKARIWLMVYGAAGLVLAALFYFAALEIHGVLEYLPLVPEQGIIIFLLFLGLEFLEMGGTVFGMMWLAARVPMVVLDVIAPVYVALGGIY